MDFSKPEEYLREIINFLDNVTILKDNLQFKTFKNINGSQASHLIYLLINVYAPNYAAAPKFEESEIQGLFNFLHYPGKIRSDAISAVGAQTSMPYLLKALYWLFLITKVYYIHKSPVDSSEIIKEEDEDALSNAGDVEMKDTLLFDEENKEELLSPEERLLEEVY